MNMNKEKEWTRVRFIVQIIAILYWLLFQEGCDTYDIPYFLIGILGSAACCGNIKEKRRFRRNRESRIIVFSSLFFTLMIASANFYFLGLLVKGKSLFAGFCACCSVLMILAGSFFSAWNILTWLESRIKDFYWESRVYKWPAAGFFFLSLGIVAVINISVLYIGYYPGRLSGDSFDSVQQGLRGIYNNHHPFYYTMTIKIFIDAGLRLFHDINAAVALYSVFQIIFMAACFSYVVTTQYQMGIPLKVIMGCFLWYVMMPFHLMYSFTMWKDIMFSGYVVVFTVSVFRILKNTGNWKWLNQLLMLAGSTGMCLYRSNGWFSCLLTFLVFAVLFGETENSRKMRSLFLMVLVVTFLLRHQVLRFGNVYPVDTIEYLSIPAQQIARVIKECDDVKEEHRELLGRIVDVDRLPEVYDIFISDPVKDLVRQKGNQEYLAEHKAAYLALYVEMGLAHPGQYLAAWIDQTKGYWNGGYSYWIWLGELGENELGIKWTVNMEEGKNAVEEYIWTFVNSPVLRIFVCIGFHLWLTLTVFVMCIVRKDKTGVFLTVPVLSIIVSILVSTPIYSEFRYAYVVFCCMPFFLTAPFYHGNLLSGKSGKIE